jgi:hypothetical protein
MSKETFHWQCILKNGELEQTAWLPERYANVNRFVELKMDDLWIDGWMVVAVGKRLETTYLLERARDYKRTRGASDV